MGKVGNHGISQDEQNQRYLEERKNHYESVVKKLTIMDDVFMRNVLKKKSCTEYILQIIMGEKNLRVIDQVLQKDYKNLQGKSAILDCVAVNAEGKEINVEFQHEDQGASPKRARYHSGLLDMNTLESGQDFSKLPESYVIFITRGDVLGYGLPIYHVERKIEEVEKNFKDEAHIIYVTGSNRADTELGRLMHDLNCKNPSEMHSAILAERVYELKETPEGVEIMCNEMQKILDEGIEIGTERGIEKGIKKGIEQGIEKGIKLCQGFGSSRELAKHKIMEEFSLSAEQAEEKLNLYW